MVIYDAKYKGEIIPYKRVIRLPIPGKKGGIAGCYDVHYALAPNAKVFRHQGKEMIADKKARIYRP
jgi:hypothetical protein